MIWRDLKKSHPELSVGLRTVGHWAEKIGDDPVGFVHGPGANRKGNPRANRHGKHNLTSADKFRIVNHVKKSPQSGYRQIPKAMAPLGIAVSKSTVHRAAVAAGVKSFKPTPKIVLKSYHKRKRIAFAQSHLDFPWMIVSFSDDKLFTLDGSHNAQNERYHALNRDDVPAAPKSKSLVGIKVHGCITANGALPLIRISRHLKGEDFRHLLEDILPQIRAKAGSGFVYQHDLAPEFKDQQTQLFLQDHADDFISAEEWPSRSPDFNPVEDQWAQMAKIVHEYQPKTRKQLDNLLDKAWRQVNTPARLKALYDSLPKRMQDAIDQKGNLTGHQFKKRKT